MGIAPNQSIWDGGQFGISILDNFENEVALNGGVPGLWKFLDGLSTTVPPGFGRTRGVVLEVAMGLFLEWVYDNQPNWYMPLPLLMSEIQDSFRIACKWGPKETANFSILINNSPVAEDIATIAAAMPYPCADLIPPPPPGGGGDGDGQAGGDIWEFKIQVDAALAVIAAQQREMITKMGSGNAQCCAQVTAALGALVKVVTAIANELSKGVAPIDLTAIVNALQAIPAVIGLLPDATAAGAAQISAAILQLAGGGKPDECCAQIVDQLKQMVAQRDIPHAIVAQAIDDGVIPAQYSSLLQGTPADWVHAVLAIAAMGSPVTKWIVRLVAGDEALKGGERAVSGAISTITSKLLADSIDYKEMMEKKGNPTLQVLIEVALNLAGAPLFGAVKATIEALKTQLRPPGSQITEIGGIGVNPDAVVATAAGVALGAAAAAWGLAYFGIDEGEPLAHIAETVAGLVGFEELRDVELQPLIREGIGRVAQMNARALFRQNVPGASELYGLAARGLMSPARAQQLGILSGMPHELEAPEMEASYQGIRAFMMIRLMQSGLFTSHDLQDELQFGGMRPSSQARLIHMAPYLATQRDRQRLQDEIQRAAEAGLMEDQMVAAQLDSSEHNFSRVQLVVERLRLVRLIQTSTALEKEYTELYLAGLSSEATFKANLDAIGLQPWKVTNLAGVAEARSAARLARTEAAELRREVRETEMVERRAALANYASGIINEPLLVQALIAAGMTPIQAAAAADIAALRKQGALRWIYGLQLDPEAAQLLKQRVADLTVQVENQLITPLAFNTAIAALGIPDDPRNALVAAAMARLKSKVKGSLVAVETA